MRKHAETVEDDQGGEANEKQRQRRPQALAGGAVRKGKRNGDHRGQEHCDPQQFDIGGDVSGLVRNRVAGPDDLRDVVDCAADEDARVSVVKAD